MTRPDLNRIIIEAFARLGWVMIGWLGCLLMLYVGWFFGMFTA